MAKAKLIGGPLDGTALSDNPDLATGLRLTFPRMTGEVRAGAERYVYEIYEVGHSDDDGIFRCAYVGER